MIEKRAAYFNVGDEILYGKYKNKRGRIVRFGDDGKGNPTVEIEPVPKGRKQNKTMTLFKIRRVKEASAQRVSLMHRYAETKTRQLGICGFCGRKIKVPNNLLAAHGYKRPGTGQTHGNCPGVGHPPLEASPITAEMARDAASAQMKAAEKGLKELAGATILKNPWDRKGDPIKEGHYQWVGAVELYKRQYDQAYALAKDTFDERQKILKSWKPSKVEEVTEESVQVQRDKKQRAQHQSRLEKYEALKKKALERLDKAFAALKTKEAKYKQAPTEKKLNAVASSANTIYSIVDGMNKLRMQHPNGYYHQEGWGDPITYEDIMADFGRDEIWKYMGLLEGGRYHTYKSPVFKELSKDTSSANYGYGLKTWVPKWPGFKR